MSNTGDIIRKLREESGVTAKELAHRIGLSASQMSRLESGKRRINSEVLTRIARALEVAPSQLIDDPDGDKVRPLSRSAAAPLRESIGKVIRSARRQKHLTVEDLARKVGVSRAYAISIEDGRRSGLETDFMKKACRILGIAPLDLISLAEEKLDNIQLTQQPMMPAPNTNEEAQGIPLIHSEEHAYPSEVDERGIPRGIIEDWLKIPGVDPSTSFALRVAGDAMDGSGSPSFKDQEIAVFNTLLTVNNGDFALVELSTDVKENYPELEFGTLFCQYFVDSLEHIRLQFLRSELPPFILPSGFVKRAWVMTHHLREATS
ncbi:MAG: helix-turn-helix domain-containing protein [Planctomycetia bacterium]|nr:helix-turn-helix domain-containing protein [Planctomycetia bacterium]MBL6915266.1 helix-turn-helix domain-containing protein [Planctomycetota bacterium]